MVFKYPVYLGVKWYALCIKTLNSKKAKQNKQQKSLFLNHDRRKLNDISVIFMEKYYQILVQWRGGKYYKDISGISLIKIKIDFCGICHCIKICVL